MKYYICIFSCVLCNITANLMMKAGSSHAASPYLLGLLSWRSFLGLGIFGASALFYLTALKFGSLSVSQSIVILQYVGVLIGARLLFGETFSSTQIAGCVLLCLGVLLIARGA